MRDQDASRTEAARPARKHNYLLFELTKGCQNDCTFCYNVWKEDPDYPRGELSTEEVLIVLERAIEACRPKHIGLTGGEPLLKPGFHKIAEFVVSKGVEPVLISNGVDLNEEAVKRCIDCGIKYFEVSLHSNRQEIHDGLVRRKGNLDEVIEAIMNVKRAGGHVTTVFVATKRNIQTFKDTVEVNALLGVEWMLFNRVACGGVCIDEWHDMVPSPTEIRRALDAAVGVAEEYHVGLSAGVQIQPCLVDLSQYKKVYSGACPLNDPTSDGSYFAIDPAGNLRMCNRSKIILGNLLSDAFADISNSRVVEEFGRAIPEFCLDCKLARTCAGGCKADAYSFHGTLTRPDPYLEMWKAEAIKIR